MTAPTSPLQIADYRRYLAARCAAVFATGAMAVVLGWQVYDLARGPFYAMSKSLAAFQLGVLGLVQFVPLFVLTPVAGLVADRFDRRRIASLSVLLDGGIVLALALATRAGLHSLPLLFALAALHGTARVFQGPAMSAIPPNVVPPELLPRAIAMSAMAWQAPTVLGPAFAGFLYAAGAAVPYLLGAVLLGFAALAISAIRPLPPPVPDQRRHPLREAADGFAYVWRERFLLGCVTLDLFAVLLGGVTALLPVYARDILGVGASGLGLMRAAPAAGAVVVALWLSARPFAHNVGEKMLWGVAIYGLAIFGFGVSRWMPLSLAMLALYGAGDMVSVFIRNSLVQLNTPDAMRGRVSAISGLAISASNELGEMESGIAAALLGATGAVVLGGVGAVAITALWSVLFPELRAARTFSPQLTPKEQTS